MFDEISSRLENLANKLPDGVEAYKYADLDEEELFIDESTEYESDPEEKGDNNIIDLLTKISENFTSYITSSKAQGKLYFLIHIINPYFFFIKLHIS